MYTNSKFWNELDSIGAGIARLEIEIQIGGDPRLISSIPGQFRYYGYRLTFISEKGNEAEDKRANGYIKQLEDIKSQYGTVETEEINIRTIKKAAQRQSQE